MCLIERLAEVFYDIDVVLQEESCNCQARCSSLINRKERAVCNLNFPKWKRSSQLGLGKEMPRLLSSTATTIRNQNVNTRRAQISMRTRLSIVLPVYLCISVMT